MEFEPNNIFDDRYELKELLGRGSFGEVWLSYDKVARIDVAIKIYIALDNRGLEDFRNEYRSVYDIQHPNILTPTHFDVWNNRPYLVMHYCPVSCDRKIGEMTEEEIWKFIADVSGGLSYLHEQDIIHRDIKPDNILQDSSGRYVLTDFGLSKKMRSSLRRNSTRAQHQEEASGSLSYMGPELFESKPEAVKASDIWALGVTVYEMLVGELPFMGQGGIMLKNGAEIPELPERYSYGLRKLVHDCLQKNPWDRPTAAQLSGYKGIKEELPDVGGTPRERITRKGNIALPICSIIVCSLLSVVVYKYFIASKSRTDDIETYDKVVANEVNNASPNLGVGTDRHGNDTAVNNVQVQDSYVDLGLSVLWATCNIGANSPEEYGEYYAWGEINTKEVYDVDNYKWFDTSKTTRSGDYFLLKYNDNSNEGIVDNKIRLDPEDDVATVKWGKEWRIPTYDEWNELRKNCSWEWVTKGTICGYQVRSKINNNTIFIPAAGEGGQVGHYWASTLRSAYFGDARIADSIDFNEDGKRLDYYLGWRFLRYSVRPVRSPGLEIDSDAYNRPPSREANNARPKSGVSNGEQSSNTVEYNVQPSYVDLGLSVKWAKANLDATKPEEYGGYYQWAGTRDVTDTSIYLYWDNCPHHTGSSIKSGWTKYNTKSSYGAVDNKTTLEPSDDAATVKLGSAWRIPTDAEWKELIDNCTWTWTTLNGVYGYQVWSKQTGYTDNWIFLPAAGLRNSDGLDGVRSNGCYWSSSLNTNHSNCANYLLFIGRDDFIASNSRYDGLSVRPVYDDRPGVTGVSLNQNSMNLNKGDTRTLSATVSPTGANPDVIWTSSDESVATMSATGVVTAIAKGVATITATTVSGGYSASCKVKVEDIIEGAVDLGLSVKWAECNLGATKPEEYGGYYQWAGTRDVSDTSIYLNWNKSPYHTGLSENRGWTKYNTMSSYGIVDNKTTLEESDDAATVKLGGKWRIPSDAEWSELLGNCTWTWTTLNGVKGYKVQSKVTGFTDKWIFLPTTGYRRYGRQNDVGSYGYYWSSSVGTSFQYFAHCVRFHSDGVVMYSSYRYYGQSVRPVIE